jgi:hypothetical protein
VKLLLVLKTVHEAFASDKHGDFSSNESCKLLIPQQQMKKRAFCVKKQEFFARYLLDGESFVRFIAQQLGVKPMKIRGIVNGKTIELLDELPVPDGLEIFIEIPDHLSTEQNEKWKQLQAVIGAWKDDQEIGEIFTEIDGERHADLGQPLNFEKN